MTKKNKLNDTNKGKYDNSKKPSDTQLNNMVMSSNNASQKSNNNVIINNNQLKNDTYESVCSPEDTAERIKMAQRHSIAVNNTISTTNAHNSNSSMPSNANCSNNNNNRLLKRVISAPVATTTNETKGNYSHLSYTPHTQSLSLHVYSSSNGPTTTTHCNRKSSRLEPVFLIILFHYPLQTCTYFHAKKSINFSNCHSIEWHPNCINKENFFLFSLHVNQERGHWISLTIGLCFLSLFGIDLIGNCIYWNFTKFYLAKKDNFERNEFFTPSIFWLLFKAFF